MKCSIITPAYNMERWIGPTIESVISQEGDFEIEYILQDGGSTDRTVAIFEEYRAKNKNPRVTMRAYSEKDNGMYDALNRGFARAEGDVFAWMPADDLYCPGALRVATEVFSRFPDITWLTGATGTVDEDGRVLGRGVCHLFHRPWLAAGVYGMEAYHVDQAGVFWRPELWRAVGGFPSHCKSMGDYWLWIQFAKHARLWSVNAETSMFRKRGEQDSRLYAQRGRAFMWEAREGARPLSAWLPRAFFYPYFNVAPPRVQKFMERLYPWLFPTHSLTYIEMKEGIPAYAEASSFVVR